jgi:hypothetical protein
MLTMNALVFMNMMAAFTVMKQSFKPTSKYFFNLLLPTTPTSRVSLTRSYCPLLPTKVGSVTTHPIGRVLPALFPTRAAIAF